MVVSPQMTSIDLSPLRGKTILVKFGGAAMEIQANKASVCDEIAAIVASGVRVLVVHGGGKEINRWMQLCGLSPVFVSGLRVTDQNTMQITEMVLSGIVNGELTSLLCQRGVRALGMSGRSSKLLTAVKLLGNDAGNRTIDLGNTGEVTEVNVAMLTTLLDAGFTPVISPVSCSASGDPLNVNADYAAAAIAGAMGVDRCLFLTDVDGVARNGAVLPDLSIAEARSLIAEGTIYGGMIPKVECAIAAATKGSQGVVIANAAAENVICNVLTAQGNSGTTISL